jgi:hypothetical protein
MVYGARSDVDDWFSIKDVIVSGANAATGFIHWIGHPLIG